jgi:hypothetical protein
MLADTDGVAAVFGLMGVIVGALITSIAGFYLVRRREKKDARAARRIIQSELKEAAQAIREALGAAEWPAGWTKKAWSESWSKYRPVLAVDMKDDQSFAAVASAYLFMELLETGLAAKKRPFVATDEPFLREVSKRINAAAIALQPRR